VLIEDCGKNRAGQWIGFNAQRLQRANTLGEGGECLSVCFSAVWLIPAVERYFQLGQRLEGSFRCQSAQHLLFDRIVQNKNTQYRQVHNLIPSLVKLFLAEL